MFPSASRAQAIGVLALANLFPLATPYRLLSSRRLGSSDIDPRTGCPGTLAAGAFAFPHYITQISAAQPDRKFGPSFLGVFTPNDVSSIFSFDIPAGRTNDTCTLEFLFPARHQLRTSSFSYSGGGSFFFTGYEVGSCPDEHTTFNNQPKPSTFPPFPPIHMEPGHAYTIDVGSCRFSAGTCASGVTSTNDTYYSFFQNQGIEGECPIGIYTTFS